MTYKYKVINSLKVPMSILKNYNTYNELVTS